MYKKTAFIYTLLLCIGMQLIAQVKTHGLSIDVSIDASLHENFENNGRIFVFLTQNSKLEPKEQIWPNPYNKTHIFARNIENFSSEKGIELKGQDTWTKTPDWELNSIPEGTYYVQIVWDQDTKESRIDAPGNFFAAKQEIVIDGDKKMAFTLDQVNQTRTIKEHPLSKLVDLKSDALSAWWGKDVSLKASVLLVYELFVRIRYFQEKIMKG